MAIKHTFVNGHADGPDATLVRPSDWNADHDMGVVETEIDFGTKPVPSKAFTIVDAAVGPTSKVVVNPSSNTATGRVGIDDMEWDGLTLSAWPFEGGFVVHAVAVPGPIVGHRKIHYVVG